MPIKASKRPVDHRFKMEVVTLRKQGKTQEEIACEMGVAQGTISIILRQFNLGGYLTKMKK